MARSKPKPETKVLCIPKWFDLERGHEVSNRGRPLRHGLKWYRTPVHSGASRLQIRLKYGKDGPNMEERCCYLYERCCDLVASLPAVSRGKLLDRTGRYPLTVEQLANLCEREIQWTQEVIDTLLEVGWLAWVPIRQRLKGAWTARQLCADGARIGDSNKQAASSKRVKGKGSRQGEGGTGEGKDVPARSSPDQPRIAALPAGRAREIELFMRIGFAPKAAQELALEYPESVIAEAVKRYGQRRTKKPIANPLGYIRRLLGAVQDDADAKEMANG